MSLKSGFRAALYGVVLLVVALAAGCAAPSSPPSVSPSDTETSDDAVDTSQWSSGDVDSVDLVEITDTDSLSGCSQWHVKLSPSQSPDDLGPSAWYSDATCLDDETDGSLDIPIISLTAKQVTDFRSLLDQVQLSTWNAWLDSNVPPSEQDTPGNPEYTISVLVQNLAGIFYDTITVSTTQPPNWGTFVTAIQTMSGDHAS